MKTKYGILYEKAFKRFSLGILYIILTFYLSGAFIYWLPSPFSYFFLAGCILSTIPIILLYNTPMAHIMKPIKIYLIIIIVPLYVTTILCLLKGIVTPLFWHMVIPVYLYTIFPSKKTIKWIIGYPCIMLSSFAITFILQYTIYDNAFISFEPMPLYMMLLTEIGSAFFALITICYCIYYIQYFREIQEIAQSEHSTMSKNEKNIIPQIPNDEENEKYAKIYTQIIEYIETKHPYLDPDFKIAKMAYELNINANYLARSIKENANMNFNGLINHYRIKKVKELIETNPTQYTLEYIYLSAGFKSQASFNRVFKQELNTTPSDYYSGVHEKGENKNS